VHIIFNVTRDYDCSDDDLRAFEEGRDPSYASLGTIKTTTSTDIQTKMIFAFAARRFSMLMSQFNV